MLPDPRCSRSDVDLISRAAPPHRELDLPYRHPQGRRWRAHRVDDAECWLGVGRIAERQPVI
jgi:hypothetical protein